VEIHGHHTVYVSRLHDVDGNRYIDYVLSWGPMILGHAPQDVLPAVEEAIWEGTSFGAPSPREIALGQLVQERLPFMERMRMVNSGTEATMSAIRVARGVTKRSKIVKFIGCYHGHSDSFLVQAGSGLASFGIADSAGVIAQVAGETLALPYNATDALKACFEKHGDDIACVILEAVAGKMQYHPFPQISVLVDFFLLQVDDVLRLHTAVHTVAQDDGLVKQLLSSDKLQFSIKDLCNEMPCITVAKCLQVPVRSFYA